MKRMMEYRPCGLSMATVMFGFFAKIGRRSDNGCSHQSTSPFCRAAAAVAGSGMMRHSIRGKLAILAPVPQSALTRFGELVAAAAKPIDDVRGTAAYRRRALAVMARRSFTWAWNDYVGAA